MEATHFLLLAWQLEVVTVHLEHRPRLVNNVRLRISVLAVPALLNPVVQHLLDRIVLWAPHLQLAQCVPLVPAAVVELHSL